MDPNEVIYFRGQVIQLLHWRKWASGELDVPLRFKGRTQFEYIRHLMGSDYLKAPAGDTFILVANASTGEMLKSVTARELLTEGMLNIHRVTMT